ncbi:MAG: hypothetical protein AABY16_00900, partial [Nanoarchaeota archaeon]
MTKKRVIIIEIVAIVSMLALLALALPGDSIRIISPINNANVTSLQNILFNTTYINGTDIIDPQSAAFYFNISGTWQQIGSASCNTISCESIITNTTIPDGIYSINATISNSSSSVSITNLSNIIYPFYIDSTPPSSNLTAPIPTSNYSQIITLTANVSDATVGINTVIFNITSNSNIAQSTTTTAAFQNNLYIKAFSTSQLSDGYYNITAIATDLLNNINSTSKISKILFDNTAPAVTHSCDDLTVNQDDEITCTCTATDSLAGLNLAFGSNGISFTLHPSTSSTGNNLQTTCTAEDTASNRKVSTIYYNVTSSGNSPSSSSNPGSSNSPGSSSNNNSSTNNNTQSNLSDGSTITGNVLSGNQGN